jgi:hypothetical protein
MIDVHLSFKKKTGGFKALLMHSVFIECLNALVVLALG